MEASVPGMDWFRARIEELDRRATANHDGMAKVRNQVAKHDTTVGVMSNELKNVSEDLGELKGQMKWVLRGLWLAAATFTSFTIGLAVLIVSVLK